MNEKQITIITSCYNRAATIAACMRSVMEQDYPYIEYIVVDGASTDGSLEIIRRLEAETQSAAFRTTHPHFTMRVLSEPDKGMYEALNKGIRMATGDYIGLVHSDDFLYSPQTVSHIAKRLTSTGADFLYGDGLFVNAENTKKVVRNWIGGTYRHWKVRHGWLPLHPTCYIRRSCILERGLYNESYRIAADSDFLFRYLLRRDLRVTYLREYIVRMRMGGLSTDSERRRQMWQEDLRMFRANGFRHPQLAKFEKMLWKVPQFVSAKFKK